MCGEKMTRYLQYGAVDGSYHARHSRLTTLISVQTTWQSFQLTARHSLAAYQSPGHLVIIPHDLVIVIFLSLLYPVYTIQPVVQPSLTTGLTTGCIV